MDHEISDKHSISFVMNWLLLFLAIPLTSEIVDAAQTACGECIEQWDFFLDPFATCTIKKLCTLKDSRFNKFSTIDESQKISSRAHVDGVHKAVFPLLPDDYRPLEEAAAIILKKETKADSVIIPGDIQLYGSDDVEKWISEDPITGAKVNPIFPGDDEFWEELQVVVEVQIARERGDPASNFYEWPDTWKNRTLVNLSPWPDYNNQFQELQLSDVAAAVNGEYPAYHQQIFIKKLFQEGVSLDNNLGQPFRSANDFIGQPVRLATINTWAFEAVGPVTFMLKWYFGMPRPEEIAYKIYRGDFTEDDKVPEDLIDLVLSMNLTDAHDFTAYKSTGSPFHPSYPAMHSAGSSCSLWLAAICKLTAAQYLEALRVDYAVAMGRTVAGVHYVQDNIVGLNIGQRIIREKLPKFLDEMYGYDSNLVALKLEKLSFDWKDFDSKEGTIAGESVADFLERAYSFVA